MRRLSPNMSAPPTRNVVTVMARPGASWANPVGVSRPPAEEETTARQCDAETGHGVHDRGEPHRQGSGQCGGDPRNGVEVPGIGTNQRSADSTSEGVSKEDGTIFRPQLRADEQVDPSNR